MKAERRSLRQCIGEWLRRYAPLEVLSTLTALAGATIVAFITSNAVVIAYAAAWAENVGYYGYAFAREMRWIGRATHAPIERQDAKAGNGSSPRKVAHPLTLGAGDAVSGPWFARALVAIKALIWEFGAAEVLDSFVVRPACMYGAMALLGHLGAGIVVGKIAADVIFYGIAIVFYELGKKTPTPDEKAGGDRA
ncbi:MAG: hypothetical protein AB7E81_09230 [Hyphomicrobiaceae bacterium]